MLCRANALPVPGEKTTMGQQPLLPRNRDQQHRFDLERCRQMERNGAGRGATIEGPSECAAAQGRRGKIYAPDHVPALPLSDCELTECRCRYEPAWK
jgi:hypothetical protein